MTDTAESSSTIPQRSFSRRLLLRIVRFAGFALLWLVIVGIIGWEILAVSYSSLSGRGPRYFLAALVAVASVTVLWFIRPRRYRFAAFMVIFVAVLAWYFSLSPSNNRDWAIDVSVLPWADIHGNELIVHNIRSFEYQSETEFRPVWRDQTFDLNALRTVDFSLCYWGSKNIAHGIVSFGFDHDQFLAISIETRKEKSESYSAIQGFFRQYELIYVVADEQDVLRLRTNFRHEDVYLYRTRLGPSQARAILLSYFESINSLRDHPQWYNALTENCITSIIPHARAANPSARNSWMTLLPGHTAEQAYGNGQLDDSIPFKELESRSRINDIALTTSGDADFSRQIRVTLPIPSRRE